MAYHVSPDDPDFGSGPGALAIGVAVLWLIAVPVVSWLFPPADAFNGPTVVFLALAAILPLLLVMALASVGQMIRSQAIASDRAIEGLRQSILANQAKQTATEPSVEKRLDEIAQATKKTEDAVASFTSSRQTSRLIVPMPAPHPSQEQRDLPLGTPSEDLDPALEIADLIRGLNFPDNEADTDGFAALRRTLRDRNARKLVQASQDVLTLLSQDGIYMDDLKPGKPDVALWRRFAKGERGDAMAEVGGIRDRASLALAAGRMREDAIFRDTVHHFLRKFDQMLAKFEEQATDGEVAALVDTRTARAFVLLARTTGTFD
ncbi:hypothetical protein [Yoonia sediminilitoris]|uniref:Uncharacterized protein n=1 Tax=Yoonia sediminilitoris TaxID=1286148 RepID=A0A2T6KIU1_9RHOB|nr:hypothetical protein [Yoonia sediminilitoris]PUB15581.1 hypothetical protein C8N45_104201 [Yoonia sediminilitoris]RCW96190.1 hypothetical protein DFP92_104200 [Yoonia sediminilitoris]